MYVCIYRSVADILVYLHSKAATVLHELSIKLLETLSDALAVLQELLAALEGARLLLRGELLGGEVVDTRSEAALDQRGVKAHEILHLLTLNDLSELLLLFGVQLIHSGEILSICEKLRWG